MIGKITSEHRCQVQTFTLFGIGLIDILGEYGSNIFQCPGILRRIAFHENRYLPEIDRTLFAECLHRIEHAIPVYLACPNIHRDTSGCMYPQGIFFSGNNFGQQLHKRRIFQRNDIQPGIRCHRRQVGSIGSLYRLRQCSRRLFRTAVYLHDTESFIIKRLCQIRSQIAGSDKYNRCIFYASFHLIS